jgi:hypothetical protein
MVAFFIKIIEQTGERLVAACDKEVINLELISHGVKIKVNQAFYGEELVNEKELLDEIRRCTSANVIGKEIVKVLIKNKLIHEDAVLWMDFPEKNEKIGHAILIK